MITIIEVTDTTYTVEVPITIRRRNGRPKIVLPEDGEQAEALNRDQASATLLRAVARAWDWRRRLESGEAATLQDIAQIEMVSDRFISCRLSLTYLSPEVLKGFLGHRPCPFSIKSLVEIADRPWAEQERLIFPV